MAMSDEEWVNVALSDDSVVVDLLLRLNPKNPILNWSKPVLITRPASDSDAAATASPTTPLTWTTTGGGFLRNQTSQNDDKNEVVATMKRPRKKKTLGELKEEEVLLFKENTSLKDALATLRLTFDKQRSINGSLKKMKIDFESQEAIDMAVTSPVLKVTSSDKLQPKMPSRSLRNRNPVEVEASYQLPLPNISCKLQEMGTVHLLPDLNFPLQENSSADVPYLTS